MSDFQHPKKGSEGVVSIASCDDTGLHVDAQYNPKELQIDKSVPWQKKSQANKSSDTGIQLEFTGAEGRSMTVELLFDNYEKGKGDPIIDAVSKLEEMASVIDPEATDENQRRPHLCVVTWGDKGLPSFRCVIESVTTKYTMFASDGTPLRATCTVKLKEADAVSVAKQGNK